ncbi:hypothetical protein BGZ81_001281 [Podila clonocystis]|nr:hypothetical protein BGZ81_001281 [Podila clonocystis]
MPIKALTGMQNKSALAEALNTNSTLTALYLQNNSIRDNGALALADTLKINSVLSSLDIWGNSIGDKELRRWLRHSSPILF